MEIKTRFIDIKTGKILHTSNKHESYNNHVVKRKFKYKYRTYIIQSLKKQHTHSGLLQKLFVTRVFVGLN